MGSENNATLAQDYLGHADIATTRISTHITKEELAGAAELLAA